MRNLFQETKQKTSCLKPISNATTTLAATSTATSTANNLSSSILFHLIFKNDILNLKQLLSNHCKSQKELKAILLRRMPSAIPSGSSTGIPSGGVPSSGVPSSSSSMQSSTMIDLLPLISPEHTLLLQVLELLLSFQMSSIHNIMSDLLISCLIITQI